MAAALAIAAGTIIAAKMASDASKKATKTQGASTDKALDYQKSVDAENRAAYEKSMASYNANRAMLAQRYGIDLGSPAAQGAPAGGSVSGLMSSGRPATSQASLPALPSRAQSVSGLMAPQPELGSWNDWKTQGLA